LEGLVKPSWMMIRLVSTLSVKFRYNEGEAYPREVHD
jgi:hypothetical protein